MATTTENLGLTLPAGTDKAEISVLNENFQAIDTFAGQATSDIQEAQETANAAAPQSTTYTKAEVDTALAAKLNTADVDDALSSTSTDPVQNKAVQAPVARLVDAGAKNGLNLNTAFTSHVDKGITYTNNNDGTVGVSGTSNVNDSYITLYDENTDNLFGFPKGSTVVLMSTSDNVSISLVPKKEGWGYGLTVYGYKSSPATFTIPSDFSGFLLRVGVTRKGTTVNNESVNGMICAAEDYAISPEFVPYAPSNRELYENQVEIEDAQELKTITTATITEYADSLPRGCYQAFITTGSVSDSPIADNCFVEIYVYSINTAKIIVYPTGIAASSAFYSIAKVSGTWRGWYRFEGTAVT